MTTGIRFLHTMREPEFLEQALRQGLMFTDHGVTLDPLGDTKAKLEFMHNYVLPRLIARASALGVSGPLDLNMLSYPFNSMRAEIPMICFTEVQDGRELWQHYLNFGGYGLVVSRDWLERNGGDRVLYIGNGKAVSARLHNVIAGHLLSGLQLKDGKLMFTNECMREVLDLFAYVQQRHQLVEVEWRIAGSHGFMGGMRQSGQRIPLPLDAVEEVHVQFEHEVSRFADLLKSLAHPDSADPLPPVFAQPERMASSRENVYQGAGGAGT